MNSKSTEVMTGQLILFLRPGERKKLGEPNLIYFIPD